MANLVKKYAVADASRRVDLIYKYYSVFLKTVDGRIEGLLYLIENEKESNRRAEDDDLGVRIQRSRLSNPTADESISHVTIREALKTCDFSGGVLDGTDREEEFKKEAFLLKVMRHDYDLFKRQVECLDEEDRSIFVSYIGRKKSTGEIAAEIGAGVDTTRNRIYKIKLEVKENMLEYLEGRL